MTYRELKQLCDKEIKKYPEHEKKYRKEIIIAKRFYDNDRDLYNELSCNRSKISPRYVIPFLLGFTSTVTDKEFEYVQVKPGASGGVDVDCDFSTFAKEKVQEYLIDKFGKECVLHVGTFTRFGIASAAKDLLRVYKVDFKCSNEFTKSLDSNLSWEENIQALLYGNKQQYQFYEEHKEILDFVPFLVNKVRQGGKHAGGIIILPSPVYEYIPVDRVQGELVSAFPESAAKQVLDELGVVKYDILAISILDVIRDAINMIDEKLFLIEEDGIRKVVSESYIDNEIKKF